MCCGDSLTIGASLLKISHESHNCFLMTLQCFDHRRMGGCFSVKYSAVFGTILCCKVGCPIPLTLRKTLALAL